MAQISNLKLDEQTAVVSVCVRPVHADAEQGSKHDIITFYNTMSPVDETNRLLAPQVDQYYSRVHADDDVDPNAHGKSGHRQPQSGLLWPPPPPPRPRPPATKAGGAHNLIMLLRVFFVRGLFTDKRWLFPLLLAVSAGAYEAVAATVLNVIGDFYMAISSLDAELFLQVSREEGRTELSGIMTSLPLCWCMRVVSRLSLSVVCRDILGRTTCPPFC